MSDEDAKQSDAGCEAFPEVMTVAEAARYLRLAEQVLYRHVRAGTVPASRLGKTIRFKKSVLDAWLEESAWATMGRTPPPKEEAEGTKAEGERSKEKRQQKRPPSRKRKKRDDFGVWLD